MKMYIKPIDKDELEKYLAVADLTESKSPHAIRTIYEKIESYIRSTHPQSDIRVYRKDPIVSVADNYDNL